MSSLHSLVGYLIGRAWRTSGWWRQRAVLTAGTPSAGASVLNRGGRLEVCRVLILGDLISYQNGEKGCVMIPDEVEQP